MAVTKERVIGNKNPMFLRFLNGESGVMDLLISFQESEDPMTAKAAEEALNNPPDLSEFKQELEQAVRDIIKEGPGEEFKAFVNHYMEPSLTEELEISKSAMGPGRYQRATVKDPSSTWMEGFICYNLCLYIKAFGLMNLKSCKVCGKIFSHKGQYALYCSDECKAKKDKK
jgi:hypothetical protein